MIILTILLAIFLIIAIGFIFWSLRGSKKSMRLALILACGISVLTLWTYWHIGAWSVLQYIHNQADEKTARAQIAALGGEEGVVDKLKTHLEKHPKEATGWYLLGKIYFNRNQFIQASAAFKKANALQPKQVDILVSLAESLYLSQAPRAEYESFTYLQQALAIDPHNVAALNLSALLKYKNKNYAEAIRLWQEVLLEVPKDSDTAREIKSAIRQAQLSNNVSSP